MRRFHLLGPLEVLVDGIPLSLPVGKPRVLLARLLLDANRVVGVEELIDSLWGDHPPASATKLVQAYVSQLRKALGADAIETRAPGYSLRLDRDESDLGRFEALCETASEAGDPARRSELLGQALALWRGRPLAEFGNEAFATAPSRRLAEVRLAALERHLAAELECGRHGGAIAGLEALVEEEPLREGPRRLLMLALYRSGRQADALARYREGRRLLVRELGIEPGAALQELERAILRHDPMLDESQTPSAARASVITVGGILHELLVPLCSDGRELLVVDLAGDARELAEQSGQLDRLRESLLERGVEVRTAAFTTTAAGEEIARLATEQGAGLLVTSTLVPQSVLCDVAFAPRPELPFERTGPVLVPFGGRREEWAALELGAWVARAHALPLRLLGVEGRDERRDASRMLAAASLALQRFAGVAAETSLVAAGAEGILAERGSLVVASLPSGELGPTRQALIARTRMPLLLVRGGLRPSGLAPARTLTRFTWSLGARKPA